MYPRPVVNALKSTFKLFADEVNGLNKKQVIQLIEAGMVISATQITNGRAGAHHPDWMALRKMVEEYDQT